ncbi:hypothetical protein B1A91_03040 [Neisseria meningitidis]|nr:hypothetical protein B1A92_11040 [Neisseria meningitidis]OOH00198.1 hypothetical protein B1A91_03040 [Neisseria meningitidis]
MRSLLVRAMFGERMVGRFVLQSGKRSLKIGFRRPFGLVGKGCGLKRLRAYVPHTPYTRIPSFA